MIQILYKLKYPIEIILIVIAILITSITFLYYSKDSHSKALSSIETSSIEVPSVNTIMVDLSGSVEKPDVYTISPEKTLHELIKMAGGLSKDADRDYISKHINLANTLTDKEKIYIPSEDDIEEGFTTIQTENPIQPSTVNSAATTNSTGISINNASQQELDSLPGIGPITAQKIIDNRPYKSVEELLQKKALNTTTFEKIKELIML